MPIIVMTEMLGGLILLMLAIVSRCSPGYLEWKQAQHKEYKKTLHGERV